MMDELEGVPQAIARPGMYQIALTLARLLDNTVAVAQHPGAAKNLAEILATLRKGSEKKGRLASVRQMTNPNAGKTG
ncbi:hypothetical protein JRC04_04945 [Mycolicibacterium sp. S2-37]|nr:hypothetical protein [Mycolicibacterium sp. S2-37]